MRITQIRNATVIIEWNDIHLLVDPMLSGKGKMIPFRMITSSPRRNPIIDLPKNAWEEFNSVTHAIITHCQKGHFDHLDNLGVKFLKENGIKVFSTKKDSAYLKKKGLYVEELTNESNNFFDGSISQIPCQHGYGWIAKVMENGSGYYFTVPAQPSVYILGDTILTGEVRNAIIDFQPDIIIIPAGRAKLDVGKPILMEPEEVMEIGKMTNGIVIANHMDALDHCTVSRNDLRQMIKKNNLEKIIFVPEDGEALNF